MKRLVRLTLVLCFAVPAVAAADDVDLDDDDDGSKTSLGLGVHVSLIGQSQSVLNLFLDHSTSMTSYAFGAQLTRRKGSFDMILGVDYALIAPDDGLYLEQGDDPNVPGNADYTEFKDFRLLSIGATFLWSSQLARVISLRYGAGIGIGIVLGEMTRTDTICPAGTEIKDLDDPDHCTPQPGTTMKEDDIPPVVPVVNIQAGLGFRLQDKVFLNIDGGFFFPSFFVGTSIDYHF